MTRGPTIAPNIASQAAWLAIFGSSQVVRCCQTACTSPAAVCLPAACGVCAVGLALIYTAGLAGVTLSCGQATSGVMSHQAQVDMRDVSTAL